MKRYQRVKTTMGRRYYVRMTEDEVAGKLLYNIALITVPFLSAAVMFLVWVKVG